MILISYELIFRNRVAPTYIISLLTLTKSVIHFAISKYSNKRYKKLPEKIEIVGQKLASQFELPG